MLSTMAHRHLVMGTLGRVEDEGDDVSQVLDILNGGNHLPDDMKVIFHITPNEKNMKNNICVILLNNIKQYQQKWPLNATNWRGTSAPMHHEESASSCCFMPSGRTMPGFKENSFWATAVLQGSTILNIYIHIYICTVYIYVQYIYIYICVCTSKHSKIIKISKTSRNSRNIVYTWRRLCCSLTGMWDNVMTLKTLRRVFDEIHLFSQSLMAKSGYKHSKNRWTNATLWDTVLNCDNNWIQIIIEWYVYDLFYNQSNGRIQQDELFKDWFWVDTRLPLQLGSRRQRSWDVSGPRESLYIDHKVHIVRAEIPQKNECWNLELNVFYSLFPWGICES